MRTVIVLFLSLFFGAVYANPTGVKAVTVADGSNYDMIYVRISFSVNPGVSGAISAGSVTTYFRTTTTNVASLQFDLDGALTVSSATYHGSAVVKNHNTVTDILTLTIPNIAVKGTLDSITVNYSGTPAGPLTGIPSGYNYVTHNGTQKAIYTLDEAYTGHYWWPCKESLYDKIDSCTDLVITTPNTYKVSGNGIVTEVPSGGNTITTWKTRYPIATYGINFAVANYSVNTSTLVTGGQTLNMYNYLYPEDNIAAYQNAMTDMKAMIAMYVTAFGVDYPFLNEQYGMTECTGSWGALEVQSMTFMARGGGGGYSKSTIAHELAHQWFGDMITTNTWQQVWLNEGFAQYCESVVYPENLLSAASAATSRTNLKNSVSTSSTVFVADTSNADKIFNQAGTQPYPKGAMVLSMLRAWLGTTKFNLALKNYLSSPTLRYNFTAVDSLKWYMQAQTPVNLDNFFNNWINKKGRVTYTVNYQYVTKGVYFQLIQAPTFAGAGTFDTPVPIEVKNGTGLDTTIVVIDKGGVLYNSVNGTTYGGNTIYFPLSQTANVVPIFDPNSASLVAASAITANGTLNTLIILPFKEIKLTARSEGNNARLNWSVNTDEALQSIVIERSMNGLDFSPIETIRVTQSPTHIYSGSSVDGLAGEQYYRLKIIKQDGTFVYSAIERVKKNASAQIVILPNPVRGDLNVMIPSDFNDGEVKLTIRNFFGQVVKEINWNTSDIKLTIPVKNFSAGVYNAVLTNRRKEKLQSSFVKE